MSRIISYFRNFDWILFFSILLLISFGLVEIYSVAIGQGTDEAMLNFKKQVIFVSAGLLICFLFAFFDYRHLANFSNYIYFGGILILILLLFFGQASRGTKGWFSFGIFSLQPVEFIKITLILFLARYFGDISLRKNYFKHFLITGAGSLILFFLVLFQPDFGSAFLLLALWLGMIIAAGLPARYIISIFLIISFLASFGWFFYFQDYQKNRILTFLNPEQNALEEGYNVTQAMIAVGAGRLWGSGVGFGSQSQLRFLPESQNDFIFAVIAEEFGFLGVVLVLFLFLVFFYRAFKALKNINNDFAIFFILGAIGLIFIEMFINIGMNIGIVPVVGISLPFISYGGSAMVANLIMAGIIQNIIIKSKIKF